MSRQDYLLNEITRTFTKEMKLSHKLNNLEESRFQPTLKAITYELMDKADSNGRISPQAILEVWKQYLASDSKEPEGGWLEHCYQYSRSRLFPHLEAPADRYDFAWERESLLILMYSVFKYECNCLPFDPAYNLPILSKEEIAGYNCKDEYLRLVELFGDNHVYEMMRIADTLGYNSFLEHTCKVNYVAMFIAKQLRALNIPVDLCLVSAACASHNLGRYGLRNWEIIRMPELHYYYTDFCLNRFEMPTVSHVAANYSPWDLELESISIESLIMIYSSFRVCISKDENDRCCSSIKSLQDGFNHVLNISGELTPEKESRYQKVFRKLEDFEGYLHNVGVITELPEVPSLDVSPDYNFVKPDPSILFGSEIVNQLKYSAIDHSTRLMRHFTEAKEFEKTIEFARSETHWKNKRTYLNILGEYGAYMTESQKDITLDFLYELLSHNASDIRQQAASIMGKIVGKYREEYKKQIPNDSPLEDPMSVNIEKFDKYCNMILHPEHVYSSKQRKWLLSTFDFYVASVFKHCRPECKYMYYDKLEEYFTNVEADEEIIANLASAAIRLPVESCTQGFKTAIMYFTKDVLGNYSKDVDLIILDVSEHYFGDNSGQIEMRRKATLGIKSEGITSTLINKFFLNNLKLSTNWIYKVNVIRVLNAYAKTDASKHFTLQIAMHFANLAMVSETITVRRMAGEALLDLMQELPYSDRNELVIELYHGLDMEDFQYLKTMPSYFGKALLMLPPEELDEMILCLEKIITAGTEKPTSAALVTVAKMIENYTDYDFGETYEVYRKRLIHMAGLLVKGMYSDNEWISQEAFSACGEQLFHSHKLDMEQKKILSEYCFKRILIATSNDIEGNGLDFYNNATVLSRIYRYISEYESVNGTFNMPYRDKVAYFPGTFDPFNNGHKAAVTAINEMGFEVYVAIDEFDWTKKALPHMIRKQIVQMSVADQEGIFVFPERYPINLRNTGDLHKLKELFAGRNLYIVAGFDVVQNSVVYNLPPSEGSVHEFNHIVFATMKSKFDELERINYNNISGDINKLYVRNFIEDASTANIRESLDLERDVSDLIDPLAQKYIIRNHFYSRETPQKTLYKAKEINFSSYIPANSKVIGEFRPLLEAKKYDVDSLLAAVSASEIKTTYISDGRTDAPVAFASAHVSGKTAYLDAFFVNYDQPISKVDETLLSEITINCINEGATAMVYAPVDQADCSPETIALLTRHGFVKPEICEDCAGEVGGVAIGEVSGTIGEVGGADDSAGGAIGEVGGVASEHTATLVCDMDAPIVIYRDVEDVIKKPFKSNPQVVKAVNDAHNNLLETICELYPGKLIISLSTSAIYSKVLDIITEENNLAMANANGDSDEPIYDFDINREKPYVSVPFGKTLGGVMIPDTVTKALHVTKYFASDLSSYSIRAAINYASLNDQIAVLKSFNKPLILIDDILNQGSTFKQLVPIFEEQGVDLHMVVAAVITQAALDALGEHSCKVASPYTLPKISLWFNERDCYPFIGGDGIDAKLVKENYSINLIQPYTSYTYVGKDKFENVHKYSETCMKNAKDLMYVLRKEYKKEFKKKLTLGRLGAVISEPKRPLLGVGLEYDDNISPTRYLDNDIKTLERLQKLMPGD